MTLVPLLFFASSATRLPLSTLGLLQYLAPTLQFLLGISYFHESMSTGRWVGFGLVWLALVIMIGRVDGLRRSPHRRASTPPSPNPPRSDARRAVPAQSTGGQPRRRECRHPRADTPYAVRRAATRRTLRWGGRSS